MSTRFGIVGMSIVVHGAMLVGLGAIRARESLAATAISVVDKPPAEKPKPPEPAKVEPPAPVEKAPKLARRAAAPAPQAPEQTPAAQPSLANVPDFGLELSGGPGAGGFALPAPSGPPTPQATKNVARSLSAARPSLGSTDSCTEEAGKPKPISLVQAGYTEAGRLAGVEGKVRVQLTIDESGAVVDAKVISGLGYGLDEAALAAARASTFQPALRCGKPARSTVTIGIRFTMK